MSTTKKIFTGITFTLLGSNTSAYLVTLSSYDNTSAIMCLYYVAPIDLIVYVSVVPFF